MFAFKPLTLNVEPEKCITDQENFQNRLTGVICSGWMTYKTIFFALGRFGDVQRFEPARGS